MEEKVINKNEKLEEQGRKKWA